MNNNRNNRRRGRGNRNQSGSGSGSGNQINRIDSRARGNAPQMLDKYKKLAQDAQHNGDRVQMEYYLQFADHYFRVIADNKARGRRFEEREPQQDDSEDDVDFDRPRRAERTPRQRPDDGDETRDGAGSEEGRFGQEGDAFSGDGDGDGDGEIDTDAVAKAEKAAAAERASARRSRQRKPREDSGSEKPVQKRTDRAARPERTDRPERNEVAERPEREEKPARKPARKPRRKDDDDTPAGIDSSVLPPSIRADGSGDSDGTLETVN